MAKKIMIQGTSSSVGKSILTTGICRLLKADGYTVAPFKSQNMSNNSHILEDGMQMARSQAIAAYACGIAPSADMNPILLKPMPNGITEVYVNGKMADQMNNVEYKNLKQNIWEHILTPYNRLDKEYDYVIIEGAGSPVEMNLKDSDVVNMGLAKKINSPVLLVADIDRGGVFASVKGTIDLFTESEKALVKGIIINKCIGQIDSFNEVKSLMQEITGIPVLGAIPYIKLDIEDEDNLFDSHTGPKTANAKLTKEEYAKHLDTEFDLLADTLREHLDVSKLLQILDASYN